MVISKKVLDFSTVKFPKVKFRIFRIKLNLLFLCTEKRPPKKMWHAAWDFCTESIEKGNLEDDFEFFEKYDEKKLDEIHNKKPWYEQRTCDLLY